MLSVIATPSTFSCKHLTKSESLAGGGVDSQITMPEPTDIVDSLAELDINPDIRHATYDPASGTINIVPPKPTIQQVLNCSFGSWYPKFRRVTPKARILSPLPDDFIKYLHADGIQLPNDSRLGHAGDDNSDQDSDVDDDGANDLFTFTQLDTEINDMIADLGGSVFPKLNWSSPKDAAWMAGNSLKCHTSSDVYLLLKSSDFVTHDLAHAFDECAEVPTVPTSTSSDLAPGSEKDSTFRLELVLKKWFDYAPSMEFRCFVRDQSLIAITQRDMTHYAFLLGMRSRLISIMLAFFEENIKGRFPDKDYVMDLYLTRDVTKCWLVDFSPWSTTTDTCLWSWNELLQSR